MNAARLGRLLVEAGDDRGRWAEVICDEITDPSSGLVTRDYLDKRFATAEAHLERRLGELEGRMVRQIYLTQAGAVFALLMVYLLK